MFGSVRRMPYRTMLLLFFITLLGAVMRAEAQTNRQPLRPALPARPNINLPQAPRAKPAPNPVHSAGVPANPSHGVTLDLNPGFQPHSRFDRNYNSFNYSRWNDRYGWNGYSNPYWNAYLSINSVNPAMNGYWTAAAWPMWNTNPYWPIGNMNAWSSFDPNAWNGFNLNPGWGNFYGPLGHGNGVPVGNWNPFNPAMFMNLDGGVPIRDFPR